MTQHLFPASPATLDLPAEEAIELIAALGTHEFAQSILGLVSRWASVYHCAVFELDDHLGIQLSTAASKAPRNFAEETGVLYVGAFSGLDTGLAAAGRAVREGDGVVLHHQDRSDVFDPVYRDRCYVANNINERVAIVARAPGGIVTVNLYRDAGDGPFPASELDALSKLARPLAAATLKHLEVTRPAVRNEARKATVEGLKRLLRALNDPLPDRELDVCARILVGMSSKVIARELGIQPGTVTTYRKRTYERLNISSQNELFLLCLQNTYSRAH